MRRWASWAGALTATSAAFAMALTMTREAGRWAVAIEPDWLGFFVAVLLGVPLCMGVFFAGTMLLLVIIEGP